MTYRPEPRLSKYVYFLRRADGVGPIKIGCSRLPERRLTEFYRWSPYMLTLIGKAEGGHEWERTLHKRFAAHKLHMEWFAPAPALLAGIERVVAGQPLADAFSDAVRVIDRKAA